MIINSLQINKEALKKKIGGLTVQKTHLIVVLSTEKLFHVGWYKSISGLKEPN